MASPSNVIRLKLPQTAAQADRLKKLAQRTALIDVKIIVLPDRDRFREQRTWRILFGLYQDCACVRWSRGFKKRPGVAFVGQMRPSKLPLFLREAAPLVAELRAEVHIDGDRLRRRLADVWAA